MILYQQTYSADVMNLTRSLSIHNQEQVLLLALRSLFASVFHPFNKPRINDSTNQFYEYLYTRYTDKLIPIKVKGFYE